MRTRTGCASDCEVVKALPVFRIGQSESKRKQRRGRSGQRPGQCRRCCRFLSALTSPISKAADKVRIVVLATPLLCVRHGERNRGCVAAGNRHCRGQNRGRGPRRTATADRDRSRSRDPAPSERDRDGRQGAGNVGHPGDGASRSQARRIPGCRSAPLLSQPAAVHPAGETRRVPLYDARRVYFLDESRGALSVRSDLPSLSLSFIDDAGRVRGLAAAAASRS